jgi:putative membrane protein
VWWVALALRPFDRADRLLENALVVVFVAALVASVKTFPLSRISYTLMIVFLCLHEVGAHYTYAKVPYDTCWQAVFGFGLNGALGFERNHFDRSVYFS